MIEDEAKTHITKGELLSERFAKSFRVALYRTGHNRRYDNWSEAKRLAYALGKGFDAIGKP